MIFIFDCTLRNLS